MKNIIIFLICLGFQTVVIAQDCIKGQDTRPLNTTSINLLGNASLISLNYERLFKVHPKVLIGGQLGLGYNEEFVLWGGEAESFSTIPIQVTGNFGKNKSMLEFGIGYTIINDLDKYTKNIAYSTIGYRLQPLKAEKINFRVFVMLPITDTDNTSIIFIPIGISFGQCF
ncbi:hypothetical protein E9993_15325 [Labilibacter sediminis]|nr:hypothetical protein E9993_15325 [Labilibacter sediminis]